LFDSHNIEDTDAILILRLEWIARTANHLLSLAKPPEQQTVRWGEKGKRVSWSEHERMEIETNAGHSLPLYSVCTKCDCSLNSWEFNVLRLSKRRLWWCSV